MTSNSLFWAVIRSKRVLDAKLWCCASRIFWLVVMESVVTEMRYLA